MNTDGKKPAGEDGPAARLATPPRAGQPGEQAQRRAGPSPLSDNPTGPHAPYEANDPEGLAAGKHRSAPEPSRPEPDEDVVSRVSASISVLGDDR